MTDSEIHEATQRALSLAAEYEEPYRSITFRTLLERFLGPQVREERAATALVPYQEPPDEHPLAASMGLNEFLASKNIQSHVDRVAAIAYFTYQQDERAGITTRDVVEAYARSREKKPQNIPDVIATCVRKGFLIDTERKGGMKAWLITRTGEAHVDNL